MQWKKHRIRDGMHFCVYCTAKRKRLKSTTDVQLFSWNTDSLSLSQNKETDKVELLCSWSARRQKKRWCLFLQSIATFATQDFFAQCSSYHNYVSNKCCSKRMQMYIFKNCNRVHIVPCISSFGIYLWHKHDGPHLTLDCWPQSVLLKGLCKNRKFYTVV